MTKLLSDDNMSVDEENKKNSNGLEKPQQQQHNPDRSREWFGVQLEVCHFFFLMNESFSGIC